MMSHRSIAIVIMTLLLTSCAPAEPAAPAAGASMAPAVPSATLVQAVSGTDVPAETGISPAMPAATSRGPNLEATDPSTVNLAGGGPQLIEFFRFT